MNITESSGAGVLAPQWLKRAAVFVLVVWVIGLGFSTVYRAGPYPLAGNAPAGKLSRWEKILGYNVDKSGAKIWGSKVHRTDFTVWTAVGHAVLDGQDIYQVENPRHWIYNNSPFFGILFVPFAVLPLWVAMALWYLLSLVVVAIGVKCSVEMAQARGAAKETFWLYALPPLLLLWPMMSGLARGQTTAIYFGLLMAGVYLAWKGRDGWGGVCLAGSILLKVFPGALLLYYAWRGRWRFVAATLLALVAATFIVPSFVYGWNRNLHYQNEWLGVLRRPSLQPEDTDDPRFGQLNSPLLLRNQSLSGAVSRLTNNADNRWAGQVIACILLVGMGWVARRAGSDETFLLLGGMMAWMLLASPVSWAHYFIATMLPLTILTRTAFEDPEATKRRLARGALIAFAVLAMAGVSKKLQYISLLCWATLLIWLAVVILAARARVVATPLSRRAGS